MVIFNYKLITMKYLSKIEKQLQDWFYWSDLGVITSFLLNGISITILLLLCCIPFIWVVFNVEQTWIHVVTFILSVPLTGFVTVFGGLLITEWIDGDRTIFKSNRK